MGSRRSNNTGNSAAVTAALRALIAAELARDAQGAADPDLQERVDQAQRHYDEVRGLRRRDESRR